MICNTSTSYASCPHCHLPVWPLSALSISWNIGVPSVEFDLSSLSIRLVDPQDCFHQFSPRAVLLILNIQIWPLSVLYSSGHSQVIHTKCWFWYIKIFNKTCWSTSLYSHCIVRFKGIKYGKSISFKHFCKYVCFILFRIYYFVCLLCFYHFETSWTPFNNCNRSRHQDINNSTQMSV